jgi:hypothetical protein
LNSGTVQAGSISARVLWVEEKPHVEVTLPGGFRILFDPESTIKSFDSEWTASPTGSPRQEHPRTGFGR